jgi:hypothetical protein
MYIFHFSQLTLVGQGGSGRVYSGRWAGGQGECGVGEGDAREWREGAQFTCFTSTKVHILTAEELSVAVKQMRYLLYS